MARIDPATGSILDILEAAADSLPSSNADGVTCDGLGNVYFAATLSGARVVASGGTGGPLRWTNASARAPVLVGEQIIVASGFAPGGPSLLELSFKDGSLLQSATLPERRDVTGLLAGGLRITSASFAAPGSMGSLGATHGTAIADRSGTSVWSDATLDAFTVIADMGRVYGIQTDAQGRGTLVALRAPVSGIEQGAWPMARHDPGHTSSAAATW